MEVDLQMKSIQEVKVVLIVVFYGVVFIAQMLTWTIINYIGAFKKSIWCIISIAVLMTIIVCSLYLILHNWFSVKKKYKLNVNFFHNTIFNLQITLNPLILSNTYPHTHLARDSHSGYVS